MGTVLVKDELTGKDFEKAKEDYKTYIKITIDIERGLVVLGGEYHADAEKLLLSLGSRQENIWGGGINLKTKEIETNAIINIRAGRNNSTEIIDSGIRKRFIKLAKRVLGKYV